ncbi:hypothetical protein LWI28_029280 [Acer negundo]|uniref:R13L1/DRL21-like LRR repeat region domain-containing protein n=1 Tax=Acer negundo TaxID=4023 RepID=A0AAD5IGZ3_ACENE|nr:hypothetical protein LWI28_029280 [Acer negundo]
MPKGIEKLTCLRTLREFYVSGSDFSSKACSIECLNQFCHLEGYLGIKGLGNLANVSEARRIQLTNDKNIYNLSLDFSGPYSVNNEAILKALQPPLNLLQLRISKYAGTVLPTWMTSITNLRRICLVEWINCQQLPSLGKVSSLESIYIRGMKSVKRVGNELLGLENDDITWLSSSLSFTALPKLKSLKFYEMEEWEGWDFGNEDDNITIMFSYLRLLEIRNCPKLKVLPKQILRAPRLEVLSIDQCTILRDHYKKGTSWSNISHIPNIKIDGQYVQRDGIELSGMDMYLTPEIRRAELSSSVSHGFGLNLHFRCVKWYQSRGEPVNDVRRR